MIVTTTPRMHWALSIKILSSPFKTTTFLTRHSLENFEIRIGSHEGEELIANRSYT